MSANTFPFVIVSGYGTPRQRYFIGAGGDPNDPSTTWSREARPWRARTLGIAKCVLEQTRSRRKHISIVKNFGTKLERVVWERNR